jgi:hypothetical protein
MRSSFSVSSAKALRLHNNHFYLIDDIACWNIFYEYLVFKLDQREGADSKYFHVVKINNNQHITIKILDIIKDNSYKHLGVCLKNFFIANDTYIKIVTLK